MNTNVGFGNPLLRAGGQGGNNFVETLWHARNQRMLEHIALFDHI